MDQKETVFQRLIFLDVLFWMVEKKHANGKSCRDEKAGRQFRLKCRSSGELSSVLRQFFECQCADGQMPQIQVGASEC